MNGVKLYVFVSGFFWVSLMVPIAEENVDCNNILEQYQRAERYMAAKNHYSTEYTAVAMLQRVYEQCKNDSPDRATMAQVVYTLGKSRWGGQGVSRDRAIACKLFKEVLEDYSDVNENDIIPWTQYFVGDCARNAFGEERNWTKAVSYYQKIIDNPQVINPNVRAWAQARVADAYREGDGIEQNDAKSVQLFTAILDNDQNITAKPVVAWAKYWIADAYEHGKAVALDREKARTMFADIVNSYLSEDPIAVEYAQQRLDAMNLKDGASAQSSN